MSIKTQLEDEIRDEFEALRKIEVGSDTYRATVEGLTKLELLSVMTIMNSRKCNWLTTVKIELSETGLRRQLS